MKKKIALPKGETYHYLDVGQGEKTLLLLHGNMASGLHYLPLIERFKADYRIISPDLRGFGDTTYNTPIDSIEDLSKDVLLLLDALQIDKVHLFGWSAGGCVAMKLAALEPNRVDKIVLIESGSYRGYPIYQKNPDGTLRIGETYKSKEALAKDPISVLPIIMAQNTQNKEFMTMIFMAALYNTGVPYKDYEIFIEEALKQRNLVDFDWALTNFNMSNFSNGMTMGDNSIKKVTHDVISFWGDKDIVVLEYMIDETIEALPNAKKIVIENAGHSPVDTHTDILVSEINNFL